MFCFHTLKGTEIWLGHLSLFAAMRKVEEISLVKSRVEERRVFLPGAFQRRNHLFPARVADEIFAHHIVFLWLWN
jgi:hypothetical protein